MMTLRYIFHSGFLLETRQCILVFDYWMDPAGVMRVYMNTCKHVYVFSSHFHEDHFTNEIFKWKNHIPNITYILSKDILKRRRAQKEDADVWMVKGTVWEEEYMKVTATGRKPTEQRELKSNSFGLCRVVTDEGDANDCTMPQVPGNRPYKKGGKVPHPKGRRGCNRCSVCTEHCPADAMLLSAPKAVDTTKCISCMKCVSVCPTGARSIGMIMNFLATQGLKKVCATRKENELFI